jgi:bifunctional DNase/RNase
VRQGDIAVLVQMELARIIISDVNEQQVVYLREIEGQRAFPILIGLFEAASINRHVKGEDSPRPLTHDLLRKTIEELGGELQDVVINNLQDHTYFAMLRVKRDGELIEIDSRPSDAIALAVQFKPPLPIYVDDSVLEQVAT